MNYLDFSKILSYNATLNFIVGERGVGKTYGTKKFCVRDYLKNKNQFVYVRRYRSELDSACSGFFDALIKNKEFKGEFLIKKNHGAYEFYYNKELIGWGIALSVALTQKSREFPYVKNIVYDEFLIPPGNYRYLKDEVTSFLDLLETIGRNRDTRAFLLGNAVARVNPYFTYFNLDEPYGSEFKTYKNNLILVCLLKNEQFRKEKKATKFGRLVEGTPYADYAIDNNWKNESKFFIKKRSEKAKFMCTILTRGEKLGLWHDGIDYYFSNKCEQKPLVTFEPGAHSEKSLLMRKNSELAKLIIGRFMNGKLYFENEKVKAVAGKLVSDLM